MICESSTCYTKVTDSSPERLKGGLEWGWYHGVAKYLLLDSDSTRETRIPATLGDNYYSNTVASGNDGNLLGWFDLGVGKEKEKKKCNNFISTWRL